MMWEEYKEDVKKKNPDLAREIDDTDACVKLVSELIKIRLEKGLTQKQLADLCGLKQSAVTRFESMDVEPRLKTFIRVCKALDLNVDFCRSERKT